MSRHLYDSLHQQRILFWSIATGMTYHVHLLDLASFRDSNATTDNVDNLLDPWAIATKMVQDVPIACYRPCSLLVFGGCAFASVWVPPAGPA
jgi:hypothetical protein